MSRYASLFTGREEGPRDAPPDTAARYTLLLVDDEPNVLNALRRVFREENYRILTAADGEQALEVLARETCQLMISDYMMPKMDGAALLRECRRRHPETIRIMLTGHADVSAVVAAVKEGAVYKFILKPWNDEDLRLTVALALEKYELAQKNQRLRQRNERQERELDTLRKLAVSNRSQLAILLHKKRLLNDNQVQELYRLQQQKRIPTLRLILDKGWVQEAQIRAILGKELMIEQVSLAEAEIAPEVLSLLPRSLCRDQWVLPLREWQRRLTLVMADPMDSGLLDDLRFTTGLQIEPVMADVAEIEAKILEAYGADEMRFEDLETLAAGIDPYEGIEVLIEDDDDATLEDLLRGTDEPPAIRLVNAIILEAVRLRASDIHIQPRAKHVVVRYRIDGVLQDKIHIPLNLLLALVSRIKVMAELDITERRRPQDGRIAVKTPMRLVDLRISTLPTINGEKVVMRLLDRNSAVLRLDEIGMSPSALARLVNVTYKPQGIVLATGPTGSGKTTTLYSMLSHSATPEKNYITIEDPVEYYLDTAGQVLVRDKIGLDFATVLRAILRQDPDVILLGEIRDHPTAEVAFHAALTGHQVFSTLHTNSAIATIARLLDLGLKPQVIAAALEAIVAQRLVRRVCADCAAEEPLPVEAAQRLGGPFVRDIACQRRGRGCPACGGTGYRGRIGLYEVLVPSERMRTLISRGGEIHELDELARSEGHETLADDARAKVAAGLTTVEEILRVLGPQEVP